MEEGTDVLAGDGREELRLTACAFFGIRFALPSKLHCALKPFFRYLADGPDTLIAGIIRQLGYTSANAQLLTIPVYVAAAIYVSCGRI